MTEPPDVEALVRHLLSYEQADEDGVMVLVSRQACDEAADALERTQAVVVAAREVNTTFACASWPMLAYGAFDLALCNLRSKFEALAALDAPPEGEG